MSGVGVPAGMTNVITVAAAIAATAAAARFPTGAATALTASTSFWVSVLFAPLLSRGRALDMPAGGMRRQAEWSRQGVGQAMRVCMV